MIVIGPEPSFSHSPLAGKKETKGLDRLEPPRERNTLGLSALITTHTYIPSLADKKGKADVAWQAGIAFAKASWLE